MASLRRHGPILAILVLFLGLGTAYSVVNPLYESPDEVWHYEYVRWLVEGRGLPRPEQVGTAPWHQEGSQPPLYYLMAGLVTLPIPTDNAAAAIRYNPHAAVGLPDSFGNKNMIIHGSADAWPWRGVVLASHAARFLSLLLGAITVFSTCRIALAIFPKQVGTAALAAAMVAFNPQFLFLSAAVNNDNLVTAASAVGVWLSVHLLARYGEPAQHNRAMPGESVVPQGRRGAGPTIRELVALGIVVGVAALAKLSGLALAAVVGLALVAVAWRRAAAFRTWTAWLLIAGAAALSVAGWWYLRNLLLYGDPLGLQAMFDVLPGRAAPPTLAELLGRAQGIWRSVWAVFGWFNVAADEWLYAIYSALSLFGVAGWVLAGPLRWLAGHAARRSRRPQDASAAAPVPDRAGEGRPSGHQLLQLLLLLIWMAILLLALISWARISYPQGRLLFPAIGAAAVLLALGLTHWVPRRLHGVLAAAAGTGLAALALVALLRWIQPAYAPPALLPPTAAVPNPTHRDFGDQVRLVGYELGEAGLFPGGTFSLTLYWEAQRQPDANYSIFVHLVDENEILQAQHDSYPATGSLPTAEWPLDAIIPDDHAVKIPATAPAPQRLRVDIGVYDFVTGRRLPVAGQDSWTLGDVMTKAQMTPDGIPHPLRVNFSDEIGLIGFDMDRRVMKPGDTLELTLWWEALAAPKQDYVVFTHLLLPPDAVWAGSDKMPQDGAAPTSRWQPGQRIEDHYRLALPAEAPAGVYLVEVGLYDPATMQRLTVNASDAGVPLGYVRVEAGGSTGP